MLKEIPDLAEIERELVRRNGLHEFMKLAWKILHPPEKPFVDSWYIQAIAEHVQALYDNDISRLFINIPPRMLKTLTCSVFAPSWMWSKKPGTKVIIASYSESLSMSAAVKAKSVMMSSWYQQRWGHKFQFSREQNSKTNFENDKNGSYVAASVGGTVLGKGADIITSDDLLNKDESESVAFRQAASRFFWETLPNRLDDRTTGRILVIQQRLHPQDTTGEILDRERTGVGRWERLILPMEYKPTTYVTVLGFKDPRTVENELLEPKRFPPEQIAALKEELGSYAYAGMYLQTPVPREGGMIKESWFKNRFPSGINGEGLTFEKLNQKKGLVKIVESVDCASKPKQRNDPMVWTMWGVFEDTEEKDGKKKIKGYHVELWDMKRVRVEFPEGLRIFKHRAEVWQQDEELIEDKDSGQQFIQVLSADKEYKIRITKIDTEGLDKATRMSAETALIERGELWLPENAPWLSELLNELCLFTGNDAGGHDDIVDSCSQFLKWFRRKFRKVQLVGPDGIEEPSAHSIY